MQFKTVSGSTAFLPVKDIFVPVHLLKNWATVARKVLRTNRFFCRLNAFHLIKKKLACHSYVTDMLLEIQGRQACELVLRRHPNLA